MMEISAGYGFRQKFPADWALTMICRYFAVLLITLSLALPVFSVELFRYRGAAKEYVEVYLRE